MKKWDAASLALNLSWTMLFSLLVPLLAGIWLDKRLDTTPLFILIGAGLGILAATVGVARMALRTFSQAAPKGPESRPLATGDDAGCQAPVEGLTSDNQGPAGIEEEPE